MKNLITMGLICLIAQQSFSQENDREKAKKTVRHIDNPVWSSRHTDTNTFNKTLASFNLSDDLLRNIDKIETDVAKNLSNKEAFLHEKTIEIRKTNNYDVLILKYCHSLTLDGLYEVKNTMVSFPIERLPPNHNTTETIAYTDNNENSSNPDAASTDQIMPYKNTSELLEQNYPNPFQIATKIHYKLPDNFTSAKIVISDINGHQLLTFDALIPGNNQIRIARGQLSQGVYFYHLLIDDNRVSTKKMIVK